MKRTILDIHVGKCEKASCVEVEETVLEKDMILLEIFPRICTNNLKYIIIEDKSNFNIDKLKGQKFKWANISAPTASAAKPT